MPPTDRVDLNDVIDLSVVELYILNYLIKIAGSVVRFSALNEINQELQDKKLSRSSFYNSLQKLEEKGFVVIEENPQGKGSLVRATELARDAVRQVNLFSIWGTIDVDKHFIDFFEGYRTQLLDESTGRSLLIPLVSPINEEVVESFENSTSQMSIVASDKDFQRMKIEMSRTSVVDGVIKEPNEFFNQVFIYRFHPNASVLSLFGPNLFGEATRVLKQGGKLVVLVVDVFPSTSNLILESLISDLFQYDFDDNQLNRLEEVLNGFELSIINKIEYKGLIGIVAQK